MGMERECAIAIVRDEVSPGGLANAGPPGMANAAGCARSKKTRFDLRVVQMENRDIYTRKQGLYDVPCTY